MIRSIGCEKGFLLVFASIEGPDTAILVVDDSWAIAL